MTTRRKFLATGGMVTAAVLAPAAAAVEQSAARRSGNRMAVSTYSFWQFRHADLRDIDRQWPQVKGAFLIDRDGIVRWAHIECADEGVAGLGKFPSDEELLAAARAIA